MEIFEGPPAELSTLAQFRDFWNELHQGIDLIVPKEPNPDSSCREWIQIQYTNGVVDKKRGVERSPKGSLDEYLDEGEPISSCRIGGHMAALGGERSYKTTYQLLPNDDKTSRLTVFLEIPKEEHFQKSSEGWAVEKVVSESDFELENSRYPVHEGILNTLFFNDWKQGDFAAAFPELAEEATRFGITTLDINDAVRRIESEAASAEKSVSLVGVTIPLSLIWQWGALVLIATQFYLWLHLHELVKRIEPDAEGWNVAWIGIYRSRAAFFLTLISSSILPVIASAYLGTTIATVHPFLPQANVAACVAVISISTVLGALTAFRIHDLYGGLAERSKPVKELESRGEVETGQKINPDDWV